MIFRRRGTSWKRKQKAAAPGRYYGNGGTIHHSGHLDVETHHGTVVAVWFRCQQLPFQQSAVNADRAADMESVPDLPLLTGVEVLDTADSEVSGSSSRGYAA